MVRTTRTMPRVMNRSSTLATFQTFQGLADVKKCAKRNSDGRTVAAASADREQLFQRVARNLADCARVERPSPLGLQPGLVQRRRNCLKGGSSRAHVDHQAHNL